MLLCENFICSRFLSSRSAKKKSKASKNVDIGKPYVSHSPAKSPLVFSNGNASLGTTAVPEIPRATVQSSWNARDNYEMSPRNGRQNGDRNMVSVPPYVFDMQPLQQSLWVLLTAQSNVAPMGNESTVKMTKQTEKGNRYSWGLSND